MTSDGRKVVKLRYPIEFGSERVEELAFRRPVAKDVRGQKLNDGSMDMILAMAGRLSGQPDHVIDRLDWADLMEVAAVVGGFLGAGQATGSDDSEQ